MKDFISAALPWIITGIVLAVLCVSFFVRKKRSDSDDVKEDNYGLVGMVIGMCIGSAVGALSEYLSIGMTTGMLIGLSIGMCFKKPAKEKNEDSNNQRTKS